ncbi:MAG: hypothetical protein WC145_09190 [Aliarcobacter sp.]|jgi:hypothetical protein
MHDPRVEGDDRIKAIVEQSIDYLVELSMMCGSADGVREEVDNMILNFLCGAECLIEEAGKVYGPGVLPCADEVHTAYETYSQLCCAVVEERKECGDV